MSLSKDEVNQIAEAISLKSSLSIKDHCSQHAFINTLIKKEERKQELWLKIKVQVLGWGFIAVIGFIGTWVYNQLR
jgi:hypothetical protein|tara:strand:- start:3011 stop:3238 length:228 start_codon:yes stop_codon:yes gene_type:complete